jgi:hypothetical protein
VHHLGQLPQQHSILLQQLARTQLVVGACLQQQQSCGVYAGSNLGVK